MDSSNTKEDRVRCGSVLYEGKIEGQERLRKIAILLYGQLKGVAEALAACGTIGKVIVLTDYNMSIASMQKARKWSKARTAEVRQVIGIIREQKQAIGPTASSLGGIQFYLRIRDNEGAVKRHKLDTSKEKLAF